MGLQFGWKTCNGISNKYEQWKGVPEKSLNTISRHNKQIKFTLREKTAPISILYGSHFKISFSISSWSGNDKYLMYTSSFKVKENSLFA